MTQHTLPKILTLVDWNAKKGVIAKMAGETGMGAALTKLDTAWKKAKWNLIDPDEGIRLKAGVTGKQTMVAYNLAEPLALGEISKVPAVQTELRAVNKLAGELEIKWKASKVIPSSSRVHVGTIKTESQKLYIDLAHDKLVAPWNAAKQRIGDKEKLLKVQALTVIKPYFASIRKFGAELKTTPTVDGYGALNSKQGFHQNIRGLNAALDRSMEPAWISWKTQHWLPLTNQNYPPRQPEDVLPKVNHVLDVLDQLERLVGA